MLVITNDEFVTVSSPWNTPEVSVDQIEVIVSGKKAVLCPCSAFEFDHGSKDCDGGWPQKEKK